MRGLRLVRCRRRWHSVSGNGNRLPPAALPVPPSCLTPTPRRGDPRRHMRLHRLKHCRYDDDVMLGTTGTLTSDSGLTLQVRRWRHDDVTADTMTLQRLCWQPTRAKHSSYEDVMMTSTRCHDAAQRLSQSNTLTSSIVAAQAMQVWWRHDDVMMTSL